MKSWIPALAFLFSVLGAASSVARPADEQQALYKLDARSTYSSGCFGPCACPIATNPLRGTFILKRAEVDPLYQHYEVTEVKWSVPYGGGELQIVGAGRYQIGGEVAIMQRLSLDLSVGGDPPRHFDSGIVAGGGGFPQIDVEVSLHDQQQCMDTVLHVVAAPALAGLDDRSTGLGIRRVTPNPFRGEVELELVLPVATAVEARVYDAQGRVLRSLARDEPYSAGVHFLRWEGKTADGTELPAGLYFVRVRADGKEVRRAIVRLD